jgi:transposase
VPKAKPVSLTFEGKKLHFSTLSSAAIHFGLNPLVVVARRRQYGWTLRQALEIDKRPPRDFTRISIVVDHKTMTFRSFAAAATHFGVNEQTAYQRHYYRGWSLQEAFGVTPKHIRHSQCKELVCTLNGTTRRFTSHKEAAESHGIDPNLFTRRLNLQGWTLEEALELVPRREQKRFSKSVTIFERGVQTTFRSLGMAAKHYGIEYHTAWSRHKKGWTHEQALGLEPAPLNGRSCFGEIYLITQSSTGMRYVGQTITSIEKRWLGHVKQAQLGRSTPLHQAIRESSHSDFVIQRVATAENRHELNQLERDWVASLDSFFPNGFNVTKGGGAGPIRTATFRIDGVEFDSVAQACRHFGISNQVIRDRRERQGLPIEEAFKVDIYKGKQIVVRGIKFASRTEAIQHFGVDDGLVRKRLDMGWSIEDSFFAPDQRGTAINVGGISFSSIAAAAKHFGLSYASVYQRINNSGWTLEEAVGLVERPRLISKRGTPVRFQHQGQTYKYTSTNEAARAVGVSGTAVRDRRKLKWSWPEALGLTAKKSSRAKR